MKFGTNIQNTLKLSLLFLFSCTFAFYQFFRLSNRTQKITRILTPYQTNAATLMVFSKEDKILIKNLYKCKGYTLGNL